MARSAAKRPEVDEWVGKSFDRYHVSRVIGRGGMATVYAAELTNEHGFERPVAIKSVASHLVSSERAVKMFLDEVRIASRIHHTNVCSVLDFGVRDGAPYLVMDLLDGQSVAALSAADALPPEVAARVAADAARGLDAAHELRDAKGELLNVVHRDVSPQNLFVLSDGTVKVLDFGVAQARGKIAETYAGELRGKIAYMAPEQLRRGRVDRRADVWALGVVLWELLTHKRLFAGEDRGATIDHVLHRAVPPPETFRSTIDPELSRIVLAALERDLEARTSSARAFADSIDEYLARLGRPVGPPQVAAWVRTAEPAARAAKDRTASDPDEVVDVPTLRASAVGLTSATPTPEPEPGTARHLRSTESVPPSRYLERTLEGVTPPPTSVTPTTPSDPAGPRRRNLIPAASALGLIAIGSAIAFAVSGDSAGAPPSAGALRTNPSPARERPTGPEVGPRPAPSEAARGSGLGPARGAPPLPPLQGSPAVTPSAPVASTSPSSVPTSSPSRPGSPWIATVPVPEPEPVVPDPAEEPALDELEPESGAPPSAGGRRAPRPRPSPGTGTLSVLAIPPAHIFLGSRDLGSTPLANVSLPAGRHSLVARARGRRPTTFSVRIRAGAAARETVRLEPLAGERL